MTRALLDTSALVVQTGLAGLPPGWQWSVSSLSYAELSWGVQRASGEKRARRERVLAVAMAALGPGLPFDDLCAGHYGYLCHLTDQAGRRPRGRTTDLLIAAVARRHDAVLATANARDVLHLTGELAVLEIGADGAVIALHE